MNRTGPEYGFGLYIHWPYCARICPYCDFNVYAAKARDPSPLLRAIAEDLRAHRSGLPDHPAFETIFFGGGTPSLLAADQIAHLVQTARETFGLTAESEISLEANPNDILGADLSGWRAAGVNRLSIGVQSFDDKALQFLGRDHDAVSAMRAIELALTIFPSVSIDLIYARPGQTLKEWKSELTRALSLGAHHLSLYELTIEQRTAFGKAAERGELIPMPDDAQADLFEITQDVTTAGGFPAYEVSNHAAAPRHQSRHNMIYWQSGDWIGIGPGAHGRLTIGGERIATEAARRPADYIRSDSPALETLSDLGAIREVLAMGLRPATGIALDRLPPLGSRALKDLQDAGLISFSGGHLHTTDAGRLLTDAITAKLSP